MRNILKVFLSVCVTALAVCASAEVNISGFTPQYGVAGDYVRIQGSGFPSDQTTLLVVKFNGTKALAPYVTVPFTEIEVAVPAGATTGPITVEYGTSASSLHDFTVIGPGPYVNSFSRVGGYVLLKGKRFLDPVPVTKVTFNGKNAKSFFIANDLELQATPPDDVTTGPISVTTSMGTFTTSSNFFATPSLSSATPMSGRAGTNVIIKGNNLLGALSVQFGGLNATDFNVLSNQGIRVTVPSDTTNGKIRVNTPGGSAETATQFTVPPTIFGFTPGFGPENSSIVITGANFLAGTPKVYFNGVQAATPTDVTFGKLTAKVPVGATTGPLTITTTNGSHESAMLFYLPPTITGVTPTRGEPGTVVLITGKNLTNATAVSFGGQPAQAFTVSNNVAIYAVASAEVSSGKITVTTQAEQRAALVISMHRLRLACSVRPTGCLERVWPSTERTFWMPLM